MGISTGALLVLINKGIAFFSENKIDRLETGILFDCVSGIVAAKY